MRSQETGNLKITTKTTGRKNKLKAFQCQSVEVLAQSIVIMRRRMTMTMTIMTMETSYDYNYVQIADCRLQIVDRRS
jgi:hypothetical protein